MSYLTDVLLWMAAGSVLGLAIGEGIGHWRRQLARNRRYE